MLDVDARTRRLIQDAGQPARRVLTAQTAHHARQFVVHRLRDRHHHAVHHCLGRCESTHGAHKVVRHALRDPAGDRVERGDLDLSCIGGTGRHARDAVGGGCRSRQQLGGLQVWGGGGGRRRTARQRPPLSPFA
jgi:hypothetical protein